jgi:Ala-tRNA(Pro) deacylase
MATTSAELFAALDCLGIAHPTVSHPPLFTVEQSRSLRGSIAGGHTKKNLCTIKCACFIAIR